MHDSAVLTSLSQFRPSPPYKVTSKKYAADFNEIRTLGGDDVNTASARTADHGLTPDNTRSVIDHGLTPDNTRSVIARVPASPPSSTGTSVPSANARSMA